MPGRRSAAALLARPSRIDEETRRHIADTFSAMGDPSRAAILLHLARDEHCVSDLAAMLGITESAVSQHLRLLRALRLVRSRRQGRHVFYLLDDHHVKTLLNVCLEHVLGG
jgi:DNA-binding transcriptional ArsR family regulator